MIYDAHSFCLLASIVALKTATIHGIRFCALFRLLIICS